MTASWLNRWVRRLEVSGSSMLPTLAPGQRVTAVRVWRRLRAGDVVALVHPDRPAQWIIKRCRVVDVNGVDLRGDNLDFSTDSRDFGVVAPSDIKWLVIRSSLRT